VTSAQEIPEAIQWHEGMLLGPQHFQELSRRFQELLHYHGGLLSPFNWGVRHLRIDPVPLVEGRLRVLELEAVMPDGLVVALSQPAGPSLALDLTAFQAELATAPQRIHLAVPAQRPGTVVTQGEQARYDSIEGRPVVDQNTGEGELAIPRLRPRLSLVVGEPPPESFTSLPLAEVARTGEIYSLTSYVAPLLKVARHSSIAELCAWIATRLRERAVSLAEKLRAPSVATEGPRLLEGRLVVHSLVAALPPFEALLGCGVAHPFSLYLALCAVVGQISSLARGLVPPVLEPYDHLDPYACFQRAVGFVDRVVREGFIDTHTAYPFVLDGGVFSLKFEPAWRNRSLLLAVRRRSTVDERDTASWMAEALVGARSLIPSMREKRILGVERRPCAGEGDLVPTQGVTLYSLRFDSEFIRADDHLEIVNPGDPVGLRQPAAIVLNVQNDVGGAPT
jgi:type VI secretion system protein ImpJ